MILEDCKTLIDRIGEKKRLREHVDQLKRFQRVRDLVKSRVDGLRPLVAVLETLRRAGIADIRLGETASVTLEQVQNIAASVTEHPEAIIENGTINIVGLGSSVASVTTTLEAALRRCWGDYATRTVPTSKQEVLDVLDPAFPVAVRRIRQLAGELEQAKLVLPASDESVTEFHRKVEELQRAWQGLGGGDVPPEVLDFLKAASTTRGAALGLLTSEVSAWLSDHDILQSFSVRVAN